MIDDAALSGMLTILTADISNVYLVGNNPSHQVRAILTQNNPSGAFIFENFSIPVGADSTEEARDTLLSLAEKSAYLSSVRLEQGNEKVNLIGTVTKLVPGFFIPWEKGHVPYPYNTGRQ